MALAKRTTSDAKGVKQRWLIWFKCRGCGAALCQHDADYASKHDDPCPEAIDWFPSSAGFSAEWQQHVWEQQRLVVHDCGYLGESVAAVR